MSGAGGPAVRLDGRVAIVTGAGRGLGRAYALELARRGARVVVNDAGFDSVAGTSGGDPAPAQAVVREITDAGGVAMPSTHDIAQPQQARALAELAAGSYGRIDVLVNNAGNNRHAVFPEMKLQDLHDVLAVHLIGPVVLSQAVYPHMVSQRHGRIVHTASQVGFQGKVDSVAYGVAKEGVVGLMHAMKLHAAAHGITVNCISPVAMTRMGGVFPKEIAQQIDPSRVAAAVAWLCSDACALNGEIVIAGGGHFARAVTVESRGVDVEDDAQISAETVAARWDEIADLRDFIVYPDALAAVGATFEKIKRRAGAP